MSDKNSREVRAGCGLYEWQFSPGSGLVEKLTITIEHMKTLPPTELLPIMDWVSNLDYPWCGPEEAVRNAPDIDTLYDVIQYITVGSLA